MLAMLAMLTQVSDLWPIGPLVESSVKKLHKDKTTSHTVCHSEVSEKGKLYKREYMAKAKYMKFKRLNTEQIEFEGQKGKVGKQNARKKSEFNQKETDKKKQQEKTQKKASFCEHTKKVVKRKQGKSLNLS